MVAINSDNIRKLKWTTSRDNNLLSIRLVKLFTCTDQQVVFKQQRFKPKSQNKRFIWPSSNQVLNSIVKL